MPVIETTNLTKYYGKTLAVDNISIRVEPGQVYGFLGPNGSGKTTTIGMIVGITTPTGGSIRLFGKETSSELHRSRQRIGCTLEQPNFYPYMTGRDNLWIVAKIKGKGAAEIESVLKTVDMSDRASKVFKTFSLGMKQRLALAAALLGDPELLILDEPTNGLDPEGMFEIRELILKLANLGKTIFLSSHLLTEVERICSHVAIIKNGRLLEHGTVEEVTRGTPIIRLKANDMKGLLTTVKNYSGTQHAKMQNNAVIVELNNSDPASLNRYLSEQGIYLSDLTGQQRSLEEVFMEITGNRDPEVAEISP